MFPTSAFDPDGLLLFAFEYPPVSGGIARLSVEIGRTFERDRRNAFVLTQGCTAAPPDSGLPEVRVDARRPIRERQAFRWLRKQVRSSKGRHSTICGVWYPEGLIAYLAGVRPLVILAHGAELLPPMSRWRRPFWHVLQRLVLE